MLYDYMFVLKRFCRKKFLIADLSVIHKNMYNCHIENLLKFKIQLHHKTELYDLYLCNLVLLNSFQCYKLFSNYSILFIYSLLITLFWMLQNNKWHKGIYYCFKVGSFCRIYDLTRPAFVSDNWILSTAQC